MAKYYNKPDADIFRDTLTYIDKHGWEPRTRKSLNLAINRSCLAEFEAASAKRTLCHILGIERTAQKLLEWNDASDRTLDDVIELLQEGVVQLDYRYKPTYKVPMK